MRPFYVSLAWSSRDYAKRVWDNAAEDNILFLAGGIAFNILLAAIPFVLLLVSGLTYLLPNIVSGAINSTETDTVIRFIDQLLPAHAESSDGPIHKLLGGILDSKAEIGIYGTIGFVWLSTRLFGSLRTTLANVFDIETERGIIAGKLFDVKITILATVLFVASQTVSAYIALATSSGIDALQTAGLREETMNSVNYWIGRTISFALFALMFFALYKYLPIRRVRTSTAWVAALFTSFMFEVARTIFTEYATAFTPQSIYSGTLISLIFVVVWCYYAALIFLLGGEVGQVYELRRTRRLQREVLT